jgi:hypothetical protein
MGSTTFGQTTFGTSNTSGFRPTLNLTGGNSTGNFSTGFNGYTNMGMNQQQTQALQMQTYYQSML